MNLQSRIDAFSSWVCVHKEALRKDPLLLQEGIKLLDGSLHGECELLEGKLHIILSADDPLWYYVLAQIQVADKDIIFHAGRDPLKDADYSVTLFDRELRASQVMIHMGAQQDLHVYHEALCACSEEEATVCVKVMLEASLGDALAATQIALIIIEKQPLSEGIALNALYDALCAEMDDPSPAAIFTPYQPSLRARRPLPRFDILAGTTCLPSLVNEYYLDVSRTFRDLQHIGACPCYVCVDADVDTLEQLLDVRTEAAARLQEAFAAHTLHGLLIGSALGSAHAYIDLLLFAPITLAQLQETAGNDHVRLSLYLFHQGSQAAQLADIQADLAG